MELPATEGFFIDRLVLELDISSRFLPSRTRALIQIAIKMNKMERETEGKTDREIDQNMVLHLLIYRHLDK